MVLCGPFYGLLLSNTSKLLQHRYLALSYRQFCITGLFWAWGRQQGLAMETVFDWVSVLAFAGLITLFLQRSSMDNPPDTIWHYMPPAVGCAVANYVGNEGYSIGAVAILVCVGIYVQYVLKPFKTS